MRGYDRLRADHDDGHLGRAMSAPRAQSSEKEMKSIPAGTRK